MKSYILLAILAAVATSVVCSDACRPKYIPPWDRDWEPKWQPAGDQCGCFNNVYVRRPKLLDECQPKEKFLSQIDDNFNNIEKALKINGAPYRCNFDDFRNRVLNMKKLTQQMVEAYFSCNDADCNPALTKVMDKYVAYRSDEFNPFLRCVYSNFNPDCAQVIMHARPPAYSSFENILVGLLWCAKAKLQDSLGTLTTPATTTTTTTLPPNQVECNCVKIDARPIPKSRLECFSDKFITKLRKFVDVNFGKVFSQYDTNSTECNYSQFYGHVHRLQIVAADATAILEKCNPTMADVEAAYGKYFGVLSKYSPSVREYIVNTDRSCYFNLTKARQNPLFITDAIFGILTQCIGYTDRGSNLCSKYKSKSLKC